MIKFLLAVLSITFLGSCFGYDDCICCGVEDHIEETAKNGSIVNFMKVKMSSF